MRPRHCIFQFPKPSTIENREALRCVREIKTLLRLLCLFAANLLRCRRIYAEPGSILSAFNLTTVNCIAKLRKADTTPDDSRESINAQFFLLVTSLYAIIATSGLCTFWLSRRWHSTPARRFVPAVASVVTAMVWEALFVMLSVFALGPYASHSYGFTSVGVILLPLARFAFTAILALPAALGVAALLKHTKNA